MTYDEILTLSKGLVNDMNNESFSAGVWQDWVNAGYTDVCVRTLALQHSTAKTLAAGVAELTLPGAMFDVDSIGRGAAHITKSTVGELDVKFPNWRYSGTTGTPAYWVRRDARTVQVYPAPAATTTTIALRGWRTPPVITGTGTPLLPDAYHSAIAYFAASQAMLMDAENQAAQARAAKLDLMYQQRIAMAIQQLQTTRLVTKGTFGSDPSRTPV